MAVNRMLVQGESWRKFLNPKVGFSVCFIQSRVLMLLRNYM